MNKKRETIEVYNKNAQEFYKKFQKSGVRIVDINKAFSFFPEKLNLNVLELGCGDGRDGREILKRTSSYLGIDAANGMIQIAQNIGPRECFMVADLEDFKFPQSLDIVFAFASLLHSNKETLKKVFKEVYDVLNDHGIFYVSLKHGSYGEYLVEDELGSRTFYFYNIVDIKEIAPYFKIVFENKQNIRGQEWIELALQKKVL